MAEKAENHGHLCGLSNRTERFDPEKGCGHFWIHDGGETIKLEGAEYRQEHMCPKCGRGPFRLRLPEDFPNTLEAREKIPEYYKRAAEPRKELRSLATLLLTTILSEEFQKWKQEKDEETHASG